MRTTLQKTISLLVIILLSTLFFNSSVLAKNQPARLFSGVTGLVFLDDNQDGIYQNNEAGLAGVTISAYGGHGEILARTVSDKAGKYILS